MNNVLFTFAGVPVNGWVLLTLGAALAVGFVSGMAFGRRYIWKKR